MANQFHEILFGSAFDLGHHFAFDPFKPRVCEKERDSYYGGPVRAEPLIGEVARGMKGYAFGIQLFIEPGYERFE